MSTLICDYKNCTGCFACKDICAHDAIIVVEDETGNVFPKINQAKCVSCGLCKKICPENNRLTLNRIIDVYAVWDKNKNINSASGGAADALSRWILEHNGVVYGAVFENKNVYHKKITCIDELNLLRGSKYVKSSTIKIFKDIKKTTKQKKVLFIGTPCQVAGLKAFLGNQQDNLITIDIICHGTPPIKYLQEHITQKIKNKEWTSATFRGKYDWKITIYDNEEIIYQELKDYDEYFTAFLTALTYRENCYNCYYAKKDRIADITIGDFWGLDKKSLRTPYKDNVSVLMINTKKGIEFFNNANTNLVFEKRMVEEAINPTQENLYHPSIPNKEREKFIENYPKYGFNGAISKTNLGKNIFYAKIRRFIKKMIHL